MLSGNDSESSVDQKTTLRSAITAIVIADIAMSLDNVLAVVGATGEGSHVLYSLSLFGKVFEITDAYPLAVLGILISIPILLFASKALMKFVDKYPVLNTIGAIGIAFIGVEMFFKDTLFNGFIDHIALFTKLTYAQVIPSLSLIVIGLLFLIYKIIKK